MSRTAAHVYSDTFFDYIDTGARRSAEALIGVLNGWLAPGSVADFGCGRGVWLDVWRQYGAVELVGVDGDYVNRETLAITPQAFTAADLTASVDLGRRFDLAQSLEVGEHLPAAASGTLVESLTRASERVLFSAAVVGQGGECHINEQPLAYWQAKFAEHGYHAYDCLRPVLKGRTEIEPWYRYNAVLYVRAAAARDLPDAIRASRVPDGTALRDAGGLSWRVRKQIVARLPQNTVTRIAQMRAGYLARRAQAGMAR